MIRIKNKIARRALVIVVCYLVIICGVYLGQRYLQYEPSTINPGDPVAQGLPSAEVVTLRTDDGLELLSWYIPPATKSGEMVLFMHGNAGNIARRLHKAKEITAAGHGLLMLEYRGFGGNDGSPSEQGLYTDARAAIKFLQQKGYQPAKVVFYGESIGTGVAVEMATEFHPRGLILEAPFTSAADVARLTYFWLPVDLLLKDRYDNGLKIQNIKSPLLIMHGDRDLVVPYIQGKTLFDIAEDPKVFVGFEGGGHSDLYDYDAGGIVIKWLDQLPAR